MRIDPGLQHTQVFRVDHALPLDNGVIQITLGIAEHLLPLPAGFDMTGRQIPVGQGIARQTCIPATQILSSVGLVGRIDNTQQLAGTICQFRMIGLPRQLQ
ncbi:hypothetical protein SDC9_184695 [bioreactor metagenome]|uniref:Uncharacterized protein n=1 Tax=bioreactor metagenome TaxID=1076179 RepID=A0A645HG81_9ZZZZ